MSDQSETDTSAPAPARKKKKQAPPVQKWDVDKDWFVRQFQRTKKSQNALARHLDLPSSAMVRLFSGTRQMKMDEVEKIARFLNVSVDDVLIHAGINLGSKAMSDISLQNVINDDGSVRASPQPLFIDSATMDRLKANIPMDRRENYQVAMVRSPKGALWQLHGNLVLFEDLDGLRPAPKSVFSISRLRDGMTVMAMVENWEKTGEATIRLPSGETKKVLLTASSPVLLMVP